MMIHFDTGLDREAARRPFRREGNRAFGPGVADAKGGVAIILHALAIAKRRGMAGYRTLTVLFNPDEEKGSVGSRELIGRLARSQDYVLSYEPQDGERVIVPRTASPGGAAVKGRAATLCAPEQGACCDRARASVLLRLWGRAAGTTVN